MNDPAAYGSDSLLRMVRVLVDAGATPASAVRAATILERRGSYDAAAAELVIADTPTPVLISEFEWESLAHAIENGLDHPLDPLIENRPVAVLAP